ncbi:uncharacterized protein LOC111289730 isoform X2 [Durio zibethinus]|uniref:Uncharacterized protein LOC111289730 isoform X2 n=1 Tax=Durio zibethinus TaxID=66656 RepID=A0A6P5Y8P3_DURZI|nr:uncharacterized protein LOC111289730 isoform X2 [Durio zibethinus]
MSIAGSMLPCKVRMEYCKFQSPTILRCSHFLVISKQKEKHQIVRNLQKLQSLGTGLIRVQNTDRYRNMVVCSSVGSGPPTPSDPTPGPGSWIPWIMGILVSIILPFWRGNWGRLLKLKDEAETVIDTVEAFTDVVEKVAEQVENVADDIGNHLPEGKLKDAFELVEDIAEDTVDGARLAGEVIDKVEDIVDEVEEKVESLREPKSTHEEANEATEEEAKGHA